MFPFMARFECSVSSQLITIRLIFTVIINFTFPEMSVGVFQFIHYYMYLSLFRKCVLIIPEMRKVYIM